MISASQGTRSSSPVPVFSIVTASIRSAPWISRTSQGVSDPHRALRSPAPWLCHRRLERAEPVAPVDEHDRRLGHLGQPERPVERRVAAAHDQAALAGELRLLAHEVVEPLPFPLVDALERELARSEGAVTGRDDQRAAEIDVAGARCRARSAPRRPARPSRACTASSARRSSGSNWSPCSARRAASSCAYDAREAGHVAHVLLGVECHQLAADLLERLDDAHGRVPVPGVVGGRESGRPGAEDRHVDDARSRLRS